MNDGSTDLKKFNDIKHFTVRLNIRVIKLTGQFSDKPTRIQSCRGLVNSRTSQLADSEFLKIMELLYYICT